MKRIHKERDRLLRTLARVSGLSGAAGSFLCLLVPGVSTGLELLFAAVLSAGAVVFIMLHTARGAIAPALGVVACAIGLISLLGAAPVIDPAAAAAMTVTAAVTAASVAIPLIVRPDGPYLVLGLVAAVLIAVGVVAITGHSMEVVAIGALMGWAANATIGIWLDRSIAAAAARIHEVGRAHEAERLASELESQQRQDARVLHDTVLATLSLLAHSGVGVGAGALRQQAGDDARLLKQLRLGAPIDRGSTAVFSPESDDDSLGVTFESVRQRFARMGLDVNWHGAGRLALPRDTLDALLGALGECLENVRRHSGVSAADVTVSDDERTVRAMVTDAGSGFEPAAVDGARLGYSESVVGRLSMVGGRARIFSSPGSGTTVMLEVPKP
ncbi:sensor histidine kinase [Agromyces cerinus]|uniref:Signal transduction histidine kinase n=1 Tax=Agromyces cerinus subsp. cerinus TaxID=232089 RepID=A0A1N6HGZ1_9MICO|nr:ATP-binding protein [Agromyces cerinus]SIO19118.1 Signal transduction histidine kinase [Agromyces cerinus subsp. cerinus]